MAKSNEELHPNWRALATIHIPLKRFIKEGILATISSESSNRNENYNINCGSGEEVKQFYKEITQNSEIKAETLPKVNCRDNVPKKTETKKKILEEFEANKFFRYAQENNLTDMAYLNFKNNDINETDCFGWSALMMASCAGNKEVVEFLLKKKADKSISDKSGRTARDLAFKNRHFQIIELLENTYEQQEDQVAERLDDDEKINELEPFYCEDCQQTFKETSKKVHFTSTIHQFNVKSSDSVNKLQKFNIPLRNRGLKLMVKQGWDKESGLGPSQGGRLYPVKTVIRKDRTGLGTTQNPAKVTHFAPFDAKAVQRHKSYHQTKRKRSANDIRSEKIREWKRDRRLRNELS